MLCRLADLQSQIIFLNFNITERRLALCSLKIIFLGLRIGAAS